MRLRYLMLFALLLTMACRTSQMGTACDCLKTLKEPPANPGDASFISAREERVSCFLQARGAALTQRGKGSLCDAGATVLQPKIKDDVTELVALRHELTALKNGAATDKQKTFIENELTKINVALKAESQYIGGEGEAPKEESPSDGPKPLCNCKLPLTNIEAGLTRDPDDFHRDELPAFVSGRENLSTCLTDLRTAALAHYAEDNSECHPEPCDKRIDAVETLVVAETKRLIAERDALAKEFGAARHKSEETVVLNEIEAVKRSLHVLEPYVVIAGEDVTIRQGEFQARRKDHEAKQNAESQEKSCSDRYAFLDVSTEKDPQGLFDCVDKMRQLCRQAPVNKASCSDVISLTVNECELNLSRLEQRLREYASTQIDELTKLKAAHDSLKGDDQKKNDDQQTVLGKRLADIRKRELIPDEADLPEFSEYKQWWSKFSFGYEYVSLNSSFTKGFPRLGATIGLNLPRQAVPDVSHRNWYVRSYGFFTTFTADLTNTAEQTNTSFTTPASLGDGAKNALAVEEQIFWPLWRSDIDPLDRRLRTWFGPIFSLGGRKTDQDNFLSPRFYGGLRFARSPEMYSDLMFGRSGGLRSRRLEVRGQFPIFRFENRSRLTLGAIGNFGINKRKHQAICVADPDQPAQPVTRTCSELDSIRFYLTYDITTETLKKIFGGEK
jgi:hypothetical protein